MSDSEFAKDLSNCEEINYLMAAKPDNTFILVGTREFCYLLRIHDGQWTAYHAISDGSVVDPARIAKELQRHSKFQLVNGMDWHQDPRLHD